MPWGLQTKQGVKEGPRRACVPGGACSGAEQAVFGEKRRNEGGGVTRAFSTGLTALFEGEGNQECV